MASETDICNLAVARCGGDANISSISPPDQSAEAGHCARFYPMSRDSLLEMHDWGFATTRISLAEITNTSTEWQYCYALPSDMLNVLSILDPLALDDYSSSANIPDIAVNYIQPAGLSRYTPQTFSIEEVNGQDVLYTNMAGAILRYSKLVTDTTKFSPLFTDCLSWLLTSNIAGPIIKGEAGAKMAQDAYKMFMVKFAEATVSDANQQRHQVNQSVSWIANR